MSALIASSFLAAFSAHWAEGAAAVGLGSLSTHAILKLGDRLGSGNRSGVAPGSGLKRPALGILLTILMGLPLIRVAGHSLSLATIVSGMMGELSFLTVLLVLTGFLPGKATAWKGPGFRLPLLIAGTLLYVSVLTYTISDVYRLGYVHSSLPLFSKSVLFALIALWVVRLPVRLAMLVTLSCLAWLLGLQNSNNLWDYLVDVPLFIYLLGLSLTSAWKRRSPS